MTENLEPEAPTASAAKPKARKTATLKATTPMKEAQTQMEVVTPKAVLSPAQEKDLERLETVIKSGWKTFLEVGEALAQVRDQGLYKGKHDSFED